MKLQRNMKYKANRRNSIEKKVNKDSLDKTLFLMNKALM